MTTVDRDLHAHHDQRVFLHGATWADYERLLAVRGESAVPRITYLEGEIELMSPSTNHEWIKTILARLLEAWSEEMDVDLNGYGSWTVKRTDRERGLEPDECYILGTDEKPRPDLAIEVVITSGGLSKLEVYRGLGVPEVWFWRRDRLEVHVLRGDSYVAAPASELLPSLDLTLLARFVDTRNQPQAVRAFRAALRARTGDA
ncbi:MAG: Uma2 family endonuclease [Planctomycetota bacterium]